MKKLLLSALALLATFSVNAAETTENLVLGGSTWNIAYPVEGNVKLTSLGGYVEYKLTGNSFTAADYTGFRVEYSDLSGGVQIKMTSAETKDGTDWQGNPAQVPIVEQYVPLSADATSVTGDFSGFTDEAPTVGSFNVQAVEADATVTLVAAYLIKADGSEERLTFGGNAWDGCFAVEDLNEGPTAMQFLGQWGGQSLQLSDGTNATFTYGNNEIQVITIELAEPIGCTTNISLTDEDGKEFKWYNFAAGLTTLTATIDDGSVTKNVSLISWKANDAGDVYPATVRIKSITRVITTTEVLDEETLVEEDKEIATWDDSYVIPAATFATTQVNDILKFYVTVNASGAQIGLRNSNWENLDETTGYVGLTEGIPYQYTITSEDVLFTLQESGLILQGHDFTFNKLTQVKTADSYTPEKVIEPCIDLDPVYATGGWGDREYNTQTFDGTIVGEGAASGWWLGGKDYSDYDKVYVELSAINIPQHEVEGEMQSGYAQLFVQCATGGDETSNLTCGFGTHLYAVVDLDEYKNKTNQIVIQGSAGVTFTIVKACVCTNEYYEENILPNLPADPSPSMATAIETIGSEQADGAWYTLQGVRVAAPVKGVYIHNGKKMVLK